MTPRYGRPPETGVTYKRRPGVYAILPLRRRLLLTHQTKPKPEIQLPGGGIDAGESPLRALHREVQEETGWRIHRARRFATYRRFTFMPEYDLWAEKVCMIYVAVPVFRTNDPTEVGHSPEWLAPSNAIERLASAGDRAVLMTWLASNQRSTGRPATKLKRDN